MIDMPGWYADDSAEGIHSCADMRVSDRALHRLKAESEGLLRPEDVRRIRKKLGLSQAEAGLRIGGGPRAFQKYEAGDVLLSRAISNALRLLERYPAGLEVLEPERGKSAKPRRRAGDRTRVVAAG